MPTISRDAHAELSEATFSDLSAIRKAIPYQKVERLLIQYRGDQNRAALYGMLLGVAGHPDSTIVLERRVFDDLESDKQRAGIDGIMYGYILLTGDAGVERLVQEKLTRSSLPYEESYAALRAVKWAWHDEPYGIDRDGLRRAVRVLLSRKEFDEEAVRSLTHMRDWGAQEQVFDLYVMAERSDTPENLRKAIEEFMQEIVRDRRGDSEMESRRAKALEFLNDLESRRH